MKRNIKPEHEVFQPLCQPLRSPLRLKLLPLLLASSFGLAAVVGVAGANPGNPQVVAGQATFNQQGNILTITNTPNAIINWQNFSIGADEITRFMQQSSDSAVLNRIIGQNPSQILGALQSNGRVFLINPNGILFGRGAQVNVGGLVASSLNLSDQDFLSGKRHLSGSASSGSVKNDGTINAASGGQVYLIAPNAENNGIIKAPNGDILLAAGHSVKLVDATNPDIQVVVSSPQALAVNLGQMIAEGGRIGIYGALVKQGGRVSADSAVQGENGKIIFKASRDTLLDAGSQTSAVSSGAAGKGGEIQILGERVAVLGNASVDASGQSGGGTILLGGDVHGDNARVQNANRAILDKDATLRADAVQNGDGGKVVVWSNDTTSALGTISARGGVAGGNGGFVETSGKKTLDFHAKVNVGASQGKGGTLLLDPSKIVLIGGSGDGATDGTNTFHSGTNIAGTTLFADGDITTAGLSNIYQSEIEGLTAGTNVVLEASNSIEVSNSVFFTGGVLTVPLNSNLTIRTRNANTDGRGQTGINLVSGKEGAALEIRTQGTGSINIATGVGTAPQAADIALPKLSSASGTITVNASGALSVGNSINTVGKNVSLSGADVTLVGSSSVINAGIGNIDITATSNGGNIHFGTGSALNLSGTDKTSGVHLVADNIDLTNGIINVGTSRQVRINPNTNPRDLFVVDGKSTNQLDLTPAELNNITAGELILNSFGLTKIATPTAIAHTPQLSLFGPTVKIEDVLSLIQADGTINIGAIGTFQTEGVGSVSTNGVNGVIRIQAEGLALNGATGSINAGTGRVALAPGSATTAIHLGNDATTTSGVLGLTSVDLSKVAGGKIEVGGGNLAWDGDTTVLTSGFSASVGSGRLFLYGGRTTGNLIIDGPLSVSGNLNLVSNKLLQVTPNAAISATNLVLEADKMQLDAAAGSITAGSGLIWAVPHTSGTHIDLGSGTDNVSGTLELSKDEVNTFGGSGILRIGAAGFSGNLNISDNININHATYSGVLSLQAGGSVSQGEIATLSADRLALKSAGDVVLPGNNSVNQLAGEVTQAGGNFKFSNAKALNITNSLDGRSGIIVAAGPNYDPQAPAGVIALRANGVLSQDFGAVLSSNALYAQGSSVSLKEPNPVGVVAGHSTGGGSSDMFHFASQHAINVTTVDGFSGILHDGLPDPMAICLTGTGIGQDLTAPLISTHNGGVFLDTTGGVGLTSGGNRVGSVYGEGTAGFAFKNSIDLSVGAAGHGVSTAGNQSIQIESTGGKLTIANPVNAGSGSVQLLGQSVEFGAGGNVNGSALNVTATLASTGVIKTTGAASLGSTSSAMVLLESDNFDFTGGALAVTTSPTGGRLGFVNHTDNALMTIDNRMAGNYNAPVIVYGNPNTADANTTSAINVASALNQSLSKVGLGATGAITQTAPIIVQGLALRGGSVTLNGPNQIHEVAAVTTGGAVSLTNVVPMSVSAFSIGQGTISGISTSNGAVTINNTGALDINQPINSGSGAINVTTHSPLNVNAAVTSTTGNINLSAGPSGSPTDILTVSQSGSVSTSGQIVLRAGEAVSLVGAVTGTPTVQSQINLPSLSQCIADPTISRCSQVLPPLSSCITDPTRLGCSVVLPTIANCIATPTREGCTVVLPTLAMCIATPTREGCSVVLPNLTACIATPTLPGCNVVLPTLTACIATPTLPGCSVVLPNLTACIATPTLPGCSVVLPNLTACIATPTLPGCSVVLPNLTACIATPTLPGCSVVLPNLTACIATPTLPGCSVVLPNLTACIATPTLPGCSVVLPTLETCIATPTREGCTGVLPTLTACIATPTLPGCSVVLPNLTACIATPTLPGCNVVLPNLTACIATPTLPGCSVVLPNLTACIATPTLPGCSVVLPNLTACIATPTLPGCSVVLPNLTACIATPTLPGCNVILPNLTACIATPTLPGCTVVLPRITSCIAEPTLPGCNVVLPNLTACIATPTLPGCSVVLPNLTACIATPTLPGCTAVLPTLAQCTSNSTLPGCQIILPPTQQSTDQPASQALNESVRIINTVQKPTVVTTVAPKAAAVPQQVALQDAVSELKADASKSAADSKTTDVKPGDSKPADSKPDEKKDEKKETVAAAKDASTAKKEEPVKKLYCN